MYHYTKEQSKADSINYESAMKMKDEAKKEVDSSIGFARTLKTLKIILAFLLVGAYFYQPEYLAELIVVGLALSLLLPQGFMDTYLEKLINLRAAETDERQILNATKANEHFASAFEKIDTLERLVKKQEK